MVSDFLGFSDFQTLRQSADVDFWGPCLGVDFLVRMQNIVSVSYYESYFKKKELVPVSALASSFSSFSSVASRFLVFFLRSS